MQLNPMENKVFYFNAETPIRWGGMWPRIGFGGWRGIVGGGCPEMDGSLGWFS